MCGIVGILNKKVGKDELESDCRMMTAALGHRGPDGSGIWLDKSGKIALGHRRLSIIDLSENGSQPMISNCGNFCLSFNGEIYNYQVLKKELITLGNAFRTESDTEVLLVAFKQWGIEQTLSNLIGMFSIALWNQIDLSLYLIRDRLGIKPLYYGWLGEQFVFASELKAFKALSGFNNKIARKSVTTFFRFNYIPSPYSIYEKVWKLSPGTYLKIEHNASFPIRDLKPKKYWSIKTVFSNTIPKKDGRYERKAIKELEALIKDSIQLRMISDVSLGAFLSGGIDSSLVAGIMQSISIQKINTFSIGFREKGFNEADYAKKVAEHLGTRHHELYLSAKDSLDLIPLIPQYWDEPFSDPSQIPTFLLSKLTRKHVTVVLSGDGGDELFCGYDRYYTCERTWKIMRKVPFFLLGAAKKLVDSIPECMLNHFGHSGHKIKWRNDLFTKANYEHFYRNFVSHQHYPSRLTLGVSELETVFDQSSPSKLNKFEIMSYLDLQTYLPDDILTKVDRASMANSLEARVPILDHRIVEFAASLPLGLKFRGHKSKWILRKILEKYVPKPLFDRPKKGFGIPINLWLKKELRDWAESLLDKKLMKEAGFLNADSVHKIWGKYLKTETYWHFQIWDILMFQAWLQKDSG